MGSLGILGGTDDIATITCKHPAAAVTTNKVLAAGGIKSGGSSSDPDWEQYHRLFQHTAKLSAMGGIKGDDEDKDGICRGRTPSENDLFAEDKSLSSRPWWKANFFLSEPVLFGTWDGVFTTCMINIFGVIVFLRSGWMVAEAGIAWSVVVILSALLIILVTVLSAIGICGRCRIERGGVYFMISHVLGARIGGAVGLLYCFGQSVGAAIHVIGFGETVGEVFHLENFWIRRLAGVAVLLLLIGINLVGVLWVIKVQFVLLLVLLLAALDFVVGSFIWTDTIHGVDGYYSDNFFNNTGAAYSDGSSWFTVFGVFFPTMTGILAGINMSGDLRDPSRDIPVGTLSALGVSSFLYLLFTLVLGATCQRWALRTDYLIAQKVSALGFLFLAGLYVSSLSSCLGGLYGTPRVLQCIAAENVVPFVRVMGRGRGPNQVPVVATLVVGVVTLAFVVVGDINALAPVVAMPFLLTYAATDYAYFSMAMTFDVRQRREERMRVHGMLSPTFDTSKSPARNGYGSVEAEGSWCRKQDQAKGGGGGDLDSLFPERTKNRPVVKRQYSSQTSSIVSSPDEHSSIRSCCCDDDNNDEQSSLTKVDDSPEGITDKSQLLAKGGNCPAISGKSRTWYYALSNRWISLLGFVANILVMFFVQWIFALVNILLMWLVYFYISQANPAVSPGVAEFKLLPWIKNRILRAFGFESSAEGGGGGHIVVTPMHPGVEVMAAQLTEDNEDYSARERYHQSVLQGSRLDVFEDD